jgi:hypothetical protein
MERRMSYSRWGESDWYIFWRASDAKKADDETLATWQEGDGKLPVYRYADLKADRETAWRDSSSRVTPRDRAGFDNAVDAFLQNVDEEYREATRTERAK